jgi:Glycosyltransferase family 87
MTRPYTPVELQMSQIPLNITSPAEQTNPRIGLTSTIWIVLALLLAASMLFYVQSVLIPYQQGDAASHDRPRGNLSDLYPRWLGARELLLHGRDPYSGEITREIQAGYYGRPLEPGRPGDPVDEQRFAYPVYVVFLLAPTIAMPFSIVQIGFFWFLIAVTGATAPIWLKFIRWHCSRVETAFVAILVTGSFAAVQGFKLQQLSLVVCGLLALSALCLSRQRHLAAGVLMAFATIKPQLALPLAGWFLLWACAEWRNRWRYALGFGATLGILFGASEWVLPGWIGRFRTGVSAYRNYAGNTGSILDTLITPTGGKALAALIVLIVVLLCWKVRATSTDKPMFAFATVLVLSTTVVIVPMIAPYNQVLLLPAILFLVRERRRLLDRDRLSRLLAVTAALFIAWPWIGAIGLSILSLAFSPSQAQTLWTVPVYTTLFIPLGVLSLLFVLSGRLSGDEAHPAS